MRRADRLRAHGNGVDVYHAYKNDDENQPLSCSYDLDPSEDKQFDIRDVIDDLRNIGIEIPDGDDDAAVLVLAIDNRALDIPGVISGHLTVSDEDMAAFKVAAVVEGEEIPLKDYLCRVSGTKHANASFYLTCDRLTLEYVEDIAGALAAIHTRPRPAAMRYEVYGKSGLVVLRNGGRAAAILEVEIDCLHTVFE